LIFEVQLRSSIQYNAKICQTGTFPSTPISADFLSPYLPSFLSPYLPSFLTTSIYTHLSTDTNPSPELQATA
jgi:hypothetical protein